MTDTTTSTPQIDAGKGEVPSQAPIMKEDADPARNLFEEESSGGILEDDDDEVDPNADLEPNTDLDNDEVEDKGNDAGAKVGDIADEDVDEGEMRLPGYHNRGPTTPLTSGGGGSAARTEKLEKGALKKAEEAKKAKEKEAERIRKELAIKKEKEKKAAGRGAHT